MFHNIDPSPRTLDETALRSSCPPRLQIDAIPIPQFDIKSSVKLIVTWVQSIRIACINLSVYAGFCVVYACAGFYVDVPSHQSELLMCLVDS